MPAKRSVPETFRENVCRGPPLRVDYLTNPL